MGRAAKPIDFVLDTIGHCFICLNQILPQVTSEPSVPSRTHSLQYLSRHLKIKMRKVFNENEHVHIPARLLDNVERSTLKVSLCDQCARWNAKLSELYQQLEKIEVEAASYLELLHGQLLEADENGRSDVFRKLDSSTSEDGLTGRFKLEVAETIRKETMQKCSLKLDIAQPKIKIQKLAEDEILLITTKHRTDEVPQVHMLDKNHGIHYPTTLGLEYYDGLQSKFKNQTEISGDNGNDYLENFDDSEEQSEHFEQSYFPEECVDSGQPVDVRSSEYQQHYTKSGTGKLICNHCSKEFATVWSFSKHYTSDHLKIRFQCQLCNKLFTTKSSLKRHQTKCSL